MSTLLQDLRYGIRMLARNPGFTVVAVVTFALGIGANTAMFSVVDTVLRRALPYPDADRIVEILRGGDSGNSPPMFSYWRQYNPCFDDLTAYGFGSAVNLTGGDRPEQVQALKISMNYFRLFGAIPIMGRTFTAAEDQPGGPKALVMSYGIGGVLYPRAPGG
jgi:putative ABC transport system permease protein